MATSNEALAKEILERLIGRPIFHATITEEILYHSRYGGQLTRTPVLKLISVEGRTRDWGNSVLGSAFGSTDWTVIPLENVTLHQSDTKAAVTLPPTIFGTPYNQVRVQYEYGLKDLPSDLKQSVAIIAEGIERGDIDHLKCNLPVEVMEIIYKYGKGAF